MSPQKPQNSSRDRRTSAEIIAEASAEERHSVMSLKIKDPHTSHYVNGYYLCLHYPIYTPAQQGRALSRNRPPSTLRYEKVVAID